MLISLAAFLILPEFDLSNLKEESELLKFSSKSTLIEGFLGNKFLL